MYMYKNYSVVLILSKICVLTTGGQLARPVNNISTTSRVFSFSFFFFVIFLQYKVNESERLSGTLCQQPHIS